MAWIIVGLGNTGDEYDGTRHNVGRELLMSLFKKEGITEWKKDVKLKALSAKGEYKGEKVLGILPETFMNNSGQSLRPLIDTAKKAEKLAVLHDDLDLPIGVVKLSFGAGAGGHRGVESIQKSLKTKNFLRIRIGISPATPSGKIRKPDREKVVDFVLGTFRKSEEELLKKVKKTVGEALTLAVEGGYARAMTEINSRN